MIRRVRADGTIDTGGVFVPIPRRRVLDRISSAAIMRVVLLLAPAGYGKSVALRQYLDATNDPYVRYDVLPENAGLLGFLRGFANAIGSVAPDARATLMGAYEANATSRSVGADLAMWLHSHLKGYRGIIAIDDLHLVQEDRDVSQFIASIVERTKGRVQWIFASRSYVGLPIGTWLAYGECDLAVDEHDLQFTAEETKEAARAFRLGVRDEELNELLALTEGWPTAISFALRSSTRSVDLRSISKLTREMIYRYLAEQVFDALSDDERAFLEIAAMLPEVELDVMAAAGVDNAASLLEGIRGRAAFIQEERDRAGVFRLHDLFREFLLQQVPLHGNEGARALKTRVARALASCDRVAPALRLFADGGDRESVSELLRVHGLPLTLQGHADDVEYAIHTAYRTGAAEPHLVGLLGLTRIVKGQYAEGERLVQRALQGNADERLRTELTLRLAIARFNRGGDSEQALLDLLHDESVGHLARLEAKAVLSGYYVRSRRIDQARAMIDDVRSEIPAITDSETLAKVSQRIGLSLVELGDAEVAVPLLEEAAEIASRHSLWSLASRAYRLLSLVAVYGPSDQHAALHCAQQAAVAAGRAGDYYDLQTSLLMVLSLVTRRGDADRAVEIERQLGELRSNDTIRGPYLASSQAHRHAWAGRYADAHRLFGNILNRQSQASDRAIVHALYALCLALDGKARQSAQACEGALDVLRNARELDARFGATFYETAQLYIACAEVLNDRLTMAERVLHRRAPFAKHEVALRMRRVAEQILRAAREPRFRRVNAEDDLDAMAACGLGGLGRYFRLVIGELEKRNEEASESAELLTGTELRILRDLAAGMTPKDIAVEMDRSVNTVRNHIQSLIEKLQCHSRAEAVSAAQQMGLLKPH
jgi:LuxR family maltose regulon positive regulatory protein